SKPVGVKLAKQRHRLGIGPLLDLARGLAERRDIHAALKGCIGHVDVFGWLARGCWLRRFGGGRGGFGLCRAGQGGERHRQRCNDDAHRHGTSSRGLSSAAMSAVAIGGPRGSSHSAPLMATKSAPASANGPTSPGAAAKPTQGISNS